MSSGWEWYRGCSLTASAFYLEAAERDPLAARCSVKTGRGVKHIINNTVPTI